jgi:hypothetical protein
MLLLEQEELVILELTAQTEMSLTVKILQPLDLQLLAEAVAEAIPLVMEHKVAQLEELKTGFRLMDNKFQ